MPEIERKTCCYCGEAIPQGSKRCPYCGSIMDVVVDEFNVQGSENAEQISSTPHNGSDFGQFTVSETGQGKTMAFNQSSIAGGIPDHEVKTQRINPAVHTYIPGAFFKPMSNGLKVFLTVIAVIVPGIGQLAGLITGIVLMNSDTDADRRSFGLALLVTSIIFFLLTFCFLLMLIAALSVQ